MIDTDLEQRLQALLSATADHPIDTQRGWRKFQLRTGASSARRRRLAKMAVAGVAAVVIAAVAIPTLTRAPASRPAVGPSSPGPAAGHGPATAVYPGAVVSRIPVYGIADLAQDGTRIWAVRTIPSTALRFQLVRIDLPTGQVRLRVNLGSIYRAVAAAGGRVWLTTPRTRAGGQVVRLDPATGKVIATLHLAAGHCGYLTFSGGKLWAECGSRRFNSVVFQLDPATGRVEGQLGPVRGPIGQIALTPQGVWYATDSGVSAILASNGASPGPRRITVHDQAYPDSIAYSQSLVYSQGAIWVLANDESVVKIDPVTGHVLRTYSYRSYDPAYNGGLNFLTAGQGSLWFLDDGYPFSGVLRVSMATGKPLGGVRINSGSCGQPCSEIFDTNGTIWVPTLTSLIGINPAKLPS
jgi:hypothetical protein